MKLAAGLGLLVYLFVLCTSAMQDCTDGSRLIDGGEVYSNIDDCDTRCYCADQDGKM